ncbi:MAG TPA: ArsR family transcriptional regulator [Clostridiales bacterium]|nr:ArsR family transcriptional regulator [Clostridiales bacterium]
MNYSAGKYLNICLGYEYEKGLELIKNVTGNSPLLFKAYPDESRIKIIELVKKGELCATDISESLDIPMST